MKFNLDLIVRCLPSSRGKTLRMADIRGVVLCSLLCLLMVLPAKGFRIQRRNSDGPPVRPSNFRSVAELQNYLSELTDYYTVLGRPRFGKRSSYAYPEDSRSPYTLNNRRLGDDREIHLSDFERR